MSPALNPLESTIERDAVERAKRRGWLAIKLGGAGTGNKRGWPDRLFVKNLVHQYVEFKRLGGKVSALQQRRHTELAAQGYPVAVCYTADACTAILDGHDARRNYYPGCEDL